MTIRKRLLGGVLITSASVACIVLVGVGAIVKIKNSICQLTERSTPAQVKTLELQQVVEKISLDFMRLGVATTAEESKAISDAVSGRIHALQGLLGELERLGVGVEGIDPSAFGGLHRRVVAAVDQRRKGAEVFRTEIEAVSASLAKVNEVASGVEGRISSIKGEASKKLSRAQAASLTLNTTIKKALTLQTKLKDLEVLLGGIDAAKNKFRLTPLAERVKAVADSVQGIGYAQGEPPILSEVRDRVGEIYGKVTRENVGLLSFKGKILSGDAESEGAYSSLRNDIQQVVAGLSLKMYEAVDPLEVQILKGRQETTEALGFQQGAEKVSTLSHSVTLETRILADQAKRVMLGVSEAEVAQALASAVESQGRLRRASDGLRAALASMGQGSLAGNVALIGQATAAAAQAVGRIADAKRSVLSSETEMLKMTDAIKTASQEQSRKGEEQVKSISEKQQLVVLEVSQAVRASLSLMIAMSVVVIALVLLINGRTAFSISKGIRVAEDLIGTAARGDFTKRAQLKTSDEIGKMCENLNGLMGKLSDSLSGVTKKTEVVASSIVEQATTSEEMARRALVLTDEANGLSAAAEELSATVLQVSKNVAEASEFADHAKETAVNGSKVITGAVNGINQVSASIKGMLGVVGSLSESSTQIGEVVVVIDEIAEQTNLLALNAAIEAARAGEQGRGFAVVADEVRKLAEKTANSTTEIGKIVKTMQENAAKVSAAMTDEAREIGTVAQLAANSADSLQGIVASAEQISVMSSQIAVATEEQTQTVDAIATRVTHVFQAAQEFSSGMEHIAVATEQVGRTATELRQLVQEFKVA
ncbi:MAG: methyl-accepting chemotaxis protein [Deltaproteobacteria bacterium]|nr:methyl-accepting chemotaxis protein [Deltaproteobacteria bacterium]